MNLIYRKFDTTNNTIIIEHNNLDRKSEMAKHILSNPKNPLSDYIDTLRDTKKNIFTVNTINLSVYTYDLSAIEHNSLLKFEVKSFLDAIENIEQPNDGESLFNFFDFDNELKYNIIHEFIFFNDHVYLYYRISSNVSLMSFLNKELTYTVRYIVIPRN